MTGFVSFITDCCGVENTVGASGFPMSYYAICSKCRKRVYPNFKKIQKENCERLHGRPTLGTEGKMTDSE